MGNKCTNAPQEHHKNYNVRNWTPLHVYQWLCEVDKGELKDTAKIFKKHKINGSELISITLTVNEQRLQSMNIAIGDRLQLKHALKTYLFIHKNRSNHSLTNDDTLSLHAQSHSNKPLKAKHTLQIPNKNALRLAVPTLKQKCKLKLTLSPLSDNNNNNGRFLMLSGEDMSDTESDSKNDSENEKESEDSENDGFNILMDPSKSREQSTSTPPNNNDTYKWHNYESENLPQLPSFPNGPRPALMNVQSNSRRHTRPPLTIFNDTPQYNTAVISKRLDSLDTHETQHNTDDEYKMYNYEDSQSYDNPKNEFVVATMDSDSESDMYSAKIHKLVNKHSLCLYMLQTSKQYLLCGYLRTHGIHKCMYVPQGIIDRVLLFYDDSLMDFKIKIADLLQSDSGNNNNKCLEGQSFKFHLNMDHNISLAPMLKIKSISNESESDLVNLELSLECKSLPIKIDKCKILIHICCLCHEIKYQKMDIYVFGTDLIGDDLSFNLLNKSGLKMCLPRRDIENLTDLQFQIHATVLGIEYAPNYDNYGIIPRYNKSLRLHQNRAIKHEWELNKRVLSVLSKDKHKQRFYSTHFNYEYFCLSAYKHSEQCSLILCLNLLRLPATNCDSASISSIDCDVCVQIARKVGGNHRQVLWSEECADVKMDITYNNTYKWTLTQTETCNLFSKCVGCGVAASKEGGVCVSVEIRVTKINKGKRFRNSREMCEQIMTVEDSQDLDDEEWDMDGFECVYE